MGKWESQGLSHREGHENVAEGGSLRFTSLRFTPRFERTGGKLFFYNFFDNDA